MPPPNLREKPASVIENERIAAEFVNRGQVAEFEMNELLEAYHYYDKDHSGTIDKDEIQDVFRCVGVYISDKELRGLMLEFDPENTGELDFQRFIELMLRTYVTEDAEDEYRRAFNFINSYTRNDEAGIDLDGCLSMKTFKRVMCTVGLKVPDLELMQILTELGVQDEDRVSFALFKQVCQRVQ